MLTATNEISDLDCGPRGCWMTNGRAGVRRWSGSAWDPVAPPPPGFFAAVAVGAQSTFVAANDQGIGSVHGESMGTWTSRATGLPAIAGLAAGALDTAWLLTNGGVLRETGAAAAFGTLPFGAQVAWRELVRTPSGHLVALGNQLVCVTRTTAFAPSCVPYPTRQLYYGVGDVSGGYVRVTSEGGWLQVPLR